MLNNVYLIGRVSCPEILTNAEGQEGVVFQVAMAGPERRRNLGGGNTQYYTVLCAGELLERARGLTDGQLIAVRGRLDNDTHEVPNSPATHLHMQVLCDAFLLIDPETLWQIDPEALPDPVAEAFFDSPPPSARQAMSPSAG